MRARKIKIRKKRKCRLKRRLKVVKMMIKNLRRRRKQVIREES
jgi:hypothetical protein